MLSCEGSNDDSHVAITGAVIPLSKLKQIDIAIDDQRYDEVSRRVTQWTRRATFTFGGKNDFTLESMKAPDQRPDKTGNFIDRVLLDWSLTANQAVAGRAPSRVAAQLIRRLWAVGARWLSADMHDARTVPTVGSTGVAEFCLWCGYPLGRAASGRSCRREHETCADNARDAHREQVECPSRAKMRIDFRGQAFRWAIQQRQFPYHCDCGAYHLTSRARSGRWCEPWLAELAAVLDRRLVTRGGERLLMSSSSQRFAQRAAVRHKDPIKRR